MLLHKSFLHLALFRCTPLSCLRLQTLGRCDCVCGYSLYLDKCLLLLVEFALHAAIPVTDAGADYVPTKV